MGGAEVAGGASDIVGAGSEGHGAPPGRGAIPIMARENSAANPSIVGGAPAAAMAMAGLSNIDVVVAGCGAGAGILRLASTCSSSSMPHGSLVKTTELCAVCGLATCVCGIDVARIAICRSYSCSRTVGATWSKGTVGCVSAYIVPGGSNTVGGVEAGRLRES